MAPPDDEPEEGMTQEELSVAASSTSRSRNAFAELMAPKPKAPKTAPSSSSSKYRFDGRWGLEQYLTNPSSFPPSRVIYHNDGFVAINDLFPKATVHTLLLPRDTSRSVQHPFDALEDEAFRKQCVREVEVLKGLVATELQRLLGKDSRSEKRRQDVLNGVAEVQEGEEVDDTGLPRGRDWSKDVIAGVHAVPSMHNLHIHVLSRDLHSPRVKHRKHYNSFTTDFLVPLEAFPLPAGDRRRRTGEEGYLKKGFECWRCGGKFGNRFTELKAHLEVEFEEWRRE